MALLLVSTTSFRVRLPRTSSLPVDEAADVIEGADAQGRVVRIEPILQRQAADEEAARSNLIHDPGVHVEDIVQMVRINGGRCAARADDVDRTIQVEVDICVAVDIRRRSIVGAQRKGTSRKVDRV